MGRLISAILQVRQLLKQGNFQGVFDWRLHCRPAVLAARSLSLPVILHEANAIPGKVTRWFSPWCIAIAGFEPAAQYLPRTKTIYTGTPVRSQFRVGAIEELPHWNCQFLKTFLIVVIGIVRCCCNQPTGASMCLGMV